MNHGSLFSGIGGFELAAEWMGWENMFHCEWEDFPRKVLQYYWPKSTSYGDIKTTDFTIWRGKIDILTGGFPCQPYSQAGKRLGKEDERHLWPEMLRAIREISPTWVVGENVLGIVNWNGGVVFEEVQADLEAEAYQVQPFILPAAGVGAPHQRYRTWFVAHTKDNGWDGGGCKQRKSVELQEWCVHKYTPQRWDEIWSEFKRHCKGGLTPDTDSGTTARQNGKSITVKKNGKAINEPLFGEQFTSVQYKRFHDISRDVTDTHKRQPCEGRLHQETKETTKRHVGTFGSRQHRNAWENFPTVTPICTGNDGISARLDSITFPKWRNESIKAGGNAIVPQVALQIFKAIELFDKKFANRR